MNLYEIAWRYPDLAGPGPDGGLRVNLFAARARDHAVIMGINPETGMVRYTLRDVPGFAIDLHQDTPRHVLDEALARAYR